MISGKIKRYFLAGLAIALPLVITFVIIIYLVNLLTAPFTQILGNILSYFFSDLSLDLFYLSHQQVLLFLSKIFTMLVLFLLIGALGFLAQNYFFEKIVALFNILFERIPILNKLYEGMQKMAGTFFTPDRKVFRQVVLVPYPDPHNSCLGLVVGEALKVCEEAVGRHLISVLIPTCPIPLTGFIVMVNPNDLIYIDMKMEDAIKYILSCGILSSNPLPIISTKSFS